MPVSERDFWVPGFANLTFDFKGMNQVSMQPVRRAALCQLDARVSGGRPAPSQPRIEFDGIQIQRDEHGITRGGIRLPQVEVPVACNSSIPLADDVISYLSGSCEPFPPEEVLALYGDRQRYLARFEQATRALEKTGAVLSRDVDALNGGSAGLPLSAADKLRPCSSDRRKHLDPPGHQI